MSLFMSLFDLWVPYFGIIVIVSWLRKPRSPSTTWSEPLIGLRRLCSSCRMLMSFLSELSGQHLWLVGGWRNHPASCVAKGCFWNIRRPFGQITSYCWRTTSESDIDQFRFTNPKTVGELCKKLPKHISFCVQHKIWWRRMVGKKSSRKRAFSPISQSLIWINAVGWSRGSRLTRISLFAYTFTRWDGKNRRRGSFGSSELGISF